jgi:hypothetical protein
MTTLLTLAITVALMRAEEHAHTPPAHALAMAAALADTPSEMRPLMLAISWVESRHTPAAIGDGGRSCGAWQQQSRYSPGYAGSYWRTPPKAVCGAVVTACPLKECRRLTTDTRYAACIARRQLATMTPAEYNAGRRGARMGRGAAYEARVEAALRRIRL